MAVLCECMGGYREGDMHRMALLCKNCRKKDFDRIKYEMGSNQLVTVPDYNWITITLNDPLGVV